VITQVDEKMDAILKVDMDLIFVDKKGNTKHRMPYKPTMIYCQLVLYQHFEQLE